ncbi:AcrR family transcriptional regulator [Salinibacterium sp. CAN_S4]|uniref:TetR/AcrR family transcriptional regulator n=1 Tax=Salinibacterium sp. CAN_S4 TaxID=2787727 RepID=UPI0018EFE13C
MTSHLDPRVARTRDDVSVVALRLLIEDGWDAVTHARVAALAGYSRATIYSHWPERDDLVRHAFAVFGEMPHYEATGSVTADLLGELQTFCRAMVERRLDRALAMLAERAQTTESITPVRDDFVATGERPMRESLQWIDDPARREAALLMLCGLVTHSVLMHGSAPTDLVLDAAVDIVLRGAPIDA